MAGGVGGNGGSPNGVAGSNGSAGSLYNFVSGPAGGNNNATVTLADGTVYGPFGIGGTGGDTSDIPAGQPGTPGAVIITWGNA